MQTDVKLQQVAREEHEDGQRRDGEDEGGVAGEFVAGLGRFDDAHRKPRDEHRERGRRPPAATAAAASTDSAAVLSHPTILI